MIRLNSQSSVPKYQQLINSIIEAIDHRELVKGDQLPSINHLIKKYSVSQDTVLTAYKELKARGIISSQVGKGYYVASNKPNQKERIFVLFDSLTSYKEVLFESFLNELGSNVSVEIFFHHYNEVIFKRLIEDAAGQYTSFVIMPILKPSCTTILSKLPRKQVYILDQGGSSIGQDFPSVCQDFATDLYNALEKGIHLIRKYAELRLVISDQRRHLKEIIKSFRAFCHDFSINGEVISTIHEQSIKKGQVYIVISDKELVRLVKKVKDTELILGQDIGIISYNDTPLKEVVADGITVVSTKFAEMGVTIARMIKNKSKKHILNPYELIIRNSL